MLVCLQKQLGGLQMGCKPGEHSLDPETLATGSRAACWGRQRARGLWSAPGKTP